MLERTYTIPLRKEWLKSPKFKRTKKAVIALRQFLSRHMKTDEENVRLGKYLNEFVWSRGIRTPPPRVKVNVVKDDKGIVKAELVGAPKEEKKEEKTEKKAAVVKETPKVEEKKAEVKKEQQKVEVPKVEIGIEEKKVEAKQEDISVEKPKPKRGRPKKNEETRQEASKK